MRHSFWYDNIGPDYLAYAFNKTHEVDPNTKLFINEGCWWGYNTQLSINRTNFFYNMIVDLLNQGVPVHGVGLQFYHPVDYKSPFESIDIDLFNQQIQMFTNLGLEVHISETGCYMDCTLPSAPDISQVSKINSIYECGLPLEHKIPHRKGKDLEVGRKDLIFPFSTP